MPVLASSTASSNTAAPLKPASMLSVASLASTAYSFTDASIKRVTPIIVQVRDTAVTAAVVFKSILDRYPPLKAFVYSLGATSVIPLGVFAGFLFFTLMCCLFVAGTGIALVQGGFAMFAGFILFWFLAGAFILTCILTFWFTAGYFAFQGAKMIERASS